MDVQVAFFLPASNVFFDVGTCVAERLLYLPNVGFCFLLCLGVRRIFAAARFEKGTARYVPVWALSVVVAAAVARSRSRSFDWRDEETLFESAYDQYLSTDRGIPCAYLFRKFQVQSLPK